MERERLEQAGRQAMNIQWMDAVFMAADSTEYTAAVLYNLEKISKKEVETLLNNYGYIDDHRILVIDLETAGNIFPHRGELKRGGGMAYWKPRVYMNDFINCECSCCGFILPVHEAVQIGSSSTDYKGVKYRFCPKCGSVMDYKQIGKENEDE